MHIKEKSNSDDSGASMEEVTRHLKDTRRSVEELINYRMMLMANKSKLEETDTKKINEFKNKAISAINHLFDEDLNP